MHGHGHCAIAGACALQRLLSEAVRHDAAVPGRALQLLAVRAHAHGAAAAEGALQALRG